VAKNILIGRGDRIIEIPRSTWESHFDNAREHSQQRLAFMSNDHHRVRYYVVRQLPLEGQAIPPTMISRALNLPQPEVITVLDELEENLTFLFRNSAGEVAWAYPVTVDETPHLIQFSSGERLYGA